MSSLLPDGFVVTASGAKAGWRDPAPLEDYLLQLGRIARFGGATTLPWTVLQHSYHAYLIARVIYPEVAVQTLLHDFAEILIGDILKPFKWDGYHAPEKMHVELAAKSFGLKLDWSKKAWRRIKRADDAATGVEGYHLTEGRWPYSTDSQLNEALAVDHEWAGGALVATCRNIIEGARG